MNTNKRGLQRLKEILETRSAQETIGRIRKMDEFTKITAVAYFLDSHNILSRYHEVVEKFINENVIDETLIGEPISIVTGQDGSLQLHLSHDVSRKEIDIFLDKFWKTDIKPLLPGSQIINRQEVPSSLRDEAILRDYQSKIINRLTNQGIALKNNVSLAHVGRVIKKYKESQVSS